MQNTLPGSDTAVCTIPGWKSSQDCVDGCVPGQVSVPELEVSREEDHQHGGEAQGHQQGAEEGGVVAPGGEGGVGGSQGDGAGQGHHHSAGQQGAEEGGVVAPGGEGGVEEGQGDRAGQGQHHSGEGQEQRAGAGAVLYDGGEHLVQGGHAQGQVRSEVKSKKPKPMYFKKKRGIVQMRLSNFRKTFPNLQPTWAVTTGQGLTNEGTAALQRDLSTNGDSVRKRKLDLDFVVNSKKRRGDLD